MINNLLILKGKIISYIDIDSFHILSIRIGLGDNDPLGTSKRLNSKICSPDASATSLEGAVKEAVEPGSIIRTDGWENYGGLSKIGYVHEVIRDEADIGKNLLPRVNRVVALLKRWLLGTYQGRVEPSHLDYYLDEFTFRFNRRTSRSRGKLFYRLVQQAAAIAPILAKDVRGGIVDS